jgi:hypothetical protein
MGESYHVNEISLGVLDTRTAIALNAATMMLHLEKAYFLSALCKVAKSSIILHPEQLLFWCRARRLRSYIW